MFWKKIKLLAAATLVTTGVGLASEDHLTTDFQEKQQPKPGVQVFYVLKSILPPSDVEGSSTLQKYGIDVAPSKYFEIYVVHQGFDNNLKRTNRFQYDLSGSNFGVRFHPLREEDHWLGLTLGANWENYSSSRIFRNGIDLGISNPDEHSNYYSVLLTKPIDEKLRLNAGAKFGTARVGNIKGHSNTYALGAAYDFTPKFGVQGNYKITDLEGLDKNHTFALNLKYRPNENIKLQLNADLHTNGVTGFYPVTEPLIPGSYRQRFGNKATGAIGFTASFSLGQGSSRKTKARDTLDTPPEEPKTQTPETEESEAAPVDNGESARSDWQEENPYFEPNAPEKDKSPKPVATPKSETWKNENPYFSGKTTIREKPQQSQITRGDWRQANPYFQE